jgi:hypothetical protein
MSFERQREMTRFPRRGARRARAGGGAQQAAIAAVAIAAVLGLGALTTGQYLVAAKRQAARTYTPAKGDDIYTGAVLYMPDTGDVCHQWLFNNQNGQFTDKGNINCEEAAEQGLDGPKAWSAARIGVISAGFR